MIREALWIFNEVPEHDSVSWTALIVGYNQMGQFEVAFRLFLEMIKCRVVPTEYTLTNVLASCAAIEALDIALTVFGRIKLKNVSTTNAIISLHMQSGQVEHALAQFEVMKERDIISWNSMIAGYNQCGFDASALKMFSKMLMESKLKHDRYTMASVLSTCANLEKLELGNKFMLISLELNLILQEQLGMHALISMYSKCGGVEIAKNIAQNCGTLTLNIIAFTTLLDGYIKLGKLNPARLIFDSLEDCDVVAWTTMIAGYAQNGHNNDTMELFRSMVKEGTVPDNYTLAAILNVSSNLASLNHGKQIHATALKLGEALSVSVSNALINMYARAACTHVGLVEKGRNYFKKMKDLHGIEPTSSHCACMIDLFGRAGLLGEAQDFIERMPIEPDVIAWGSLLASCKVHKNVELAVIAADRMLSIEPDNSGAYSALANVYSACGKWEEAAKIRKSMKDRKVKKEQGISWLQIKSEVHVFGADDALHPQREAIYQMIAKIWDEIKKMGFVPDTASVLHDLDQELKEQILKHHSEKLAIAFALMNTPDNSTLRIMKNLRVCNDCHSAIKFISKLVNREIIVRDATRFHHFKNGSFYVTEVVYTMETKHLKSSVWFSSFSFRSLMGYMDLLGTVQ
ncbi:hypothetical protein DH2020_043238 [Rehmannia glutinosa]|uniref:DYW domain-containing protein n=1 Tax=Rehmannia glutinosa TaxID=99300 RepID=A0ABR0UKY9_REHGL